MQPTNPVQARTGRLSGFAAALLAIVAVAGFATSVASAGKPVPTITLVSCQNGAAGSQVTVAWTGAGKVADPVYVDVYWEVVHPDGSFDDNDLVFTGLTKAELKANQATFTVPSALLPGDTATAIRANWLDNSGSPHATPIARSANTVPCT